MSENNFLKIFNDKKGDIEEIKKIIINNKDLINSEFEINNNSKIYKYSPLTYCIEKKLSELSVFLIDQGANINYKTFPKEDYPLLIACRYGLEDIVRKLLLYDNIDINCLNKDNETWYTILLNNLNITIHNLILDFIQNKNNKKEKENLILSNNEDIIEDKKDNNNNKINSKEKDKSINKTNINKDINNKLNTKDKDRNKDKYINKKKKIMANSLSFELPIEYNDNYINAKFGKYIFIFNIFYL